MDSDLMRYLEVIDAKSDAINQLSDEIWAYAETAFSETRSVEALTAFLAKEGFTVKKGVYGVGTAFTAEYGSGRPRIGFLGEFDALSGMSQTAEAVENFVIVPGENGHGLLVIVLCCVCV